ncbi:YfcZ/YiiS family protein [Hafnia alvei]|uniref:YfcZ/YiiS family protein n=1 Tax=Hafnia alvei TaxID=569 RepID=UPI00103B22F6|nr:YfcZ/YiiS family protein [Hafnia alvei]QBJ33939.1 DUF406 family protein [Hafnia alvei]
MTDAIKKCSAQETAACCCVDVGTIMDNTDCTASYSNVFATEADAKAMLEQLTQKVRGIESDPCEIKSNITKTAEGYALTVDFAFACEAETLIFQLGLR